MTVTAIILSHFKEREKNLGIIVDDLLKGTVVPDEISIFIDNPDIEYEDDRVTIVRSDTAFLPRVRFALGSYFDTDFCFFIDDDMTVKKKTLENLLAWGEKMPHQIIGVEGSVLGKTDNPYADDLSVNRGDVTKEPLLVDVILRTYFVPTHLVSGGLIAQRMLPALPRESLDDVYLCLGSKLVFGTSSLVVPVDDMSNFKELDDHGVGQSVGHGAGRHYENRNVVCRELMIEIERNHP